MPTPVEDREKGWVGVYVNEEERRGVFVLKFVLLNIFGKTFYNFFTKSFFFFFTKSFMVNKRIRNHVFYWSTKGLEIIYFTYPYN